MKAMRESGTGLVIVDDIIVHGCVVEILREYPSTPRWWEKIGSLGAPRHHFAWLTSSMHLRQHPLELHVASSDAQSANRPAARQFPAKLILQACVDTSTTSPTIL